MYTELYQSLNIGYDMDVKFDVVRIGERRKNHLSEILLEENTIMLKNTLVDFLFDLKNSDGKNSEQVTIVVPAKGYNPKIRLQDFRDKRVRDLVKIKFSGFIYKGSDDSFLININNRVFR